MRMRTRPLGVWALACCMAATVQPSQGIIEHRGLDSFEELAGSFALRSDVESRQQGVNVALLSEREDAQKKSANATWQWQPVEARGEPPMSREGHTAIAVENYLIVFGGCFLDRQCFGDVTVFDATLDRWFAPAVSGLGPTPRQGHTASYVRERVFVFGGSSEAGYLSDMHVLAVAPQTAGEQLRLNWGVEDISGKRPSPREGHSATVVGERVFYFGGFTEAGYSSELIVLNVDLMAWERPAVAGTPPTGREGHTATLFKDKIVIFGGFTDGGCLNDVAVLDTATNTWVRPKLFGAPPRARQDHSAVRRGHTILYTGGCNFAEQECYSDSFVLDLKRREWREASFLKAGHLAPREDHSVTLVRDRVLLFGGCFLAQKCYDDLLELESNGGWRCGGNECSGHGTCSHGLCYCHKGFTGEDCSQKLECPRDCSSHGVCLSTGVCACKFGWRGEGCEEKVDCPNDCSGHGFCLPNAVCRCERGWAGAHCGLCVPSDERVCSNQGRCVMPGGKEGEEAALRAFYHLGRDMEEVARIMGPDAVEKPGQLEELSKEAQAAMAAEGDGAEADAEADAEALPKLFVGQCKCKSGFRGERCEENANCPNSCSGHGYCMPTGVCQCEPGWGGKHCGFCAPDDEAVCSHHGKCEVPEEAREEAAAALQKQTAAGGAAAAAALLEETAMAGARVRVLGFGDKPMVVAECKCASGWSGPTCEFEGDAEAGNRPGDEARAANPATDPAAAEAVAQAVAAAEADPAVAAQVSAQDVAEMRLALVSHSNAKLVDATEPSRVVGGPGGAKYQVVTPSAAELAAVDADGPPTTMTRAAPSLAAAAASASRLAAASTSEATHVEAAELKERFVHGMRQYMHTPEPKRVEGHGHLAAHGHRHLSAALADASSSEEAPGTASTSGQPVAPPQATPDSCPDRCSLHGECINHQCYCQQGWMGFACSQEAHSHETVGIVQYTVQSGLWIVLLVALSATCSVVTAWPCIKNALGMETRKDKLLNAGFV